MAFTRWTYAYLTLADVQAHAAGNPSDFGSQQDFYGDLINAACRTVEDYCERNIVARSVTETRDAAGGRYIYPRHPPVASLAIYLDTSRQFAESELLQATTPTIATDDDYYYDAVENCAKLLGWELPGNPSNPIPAIIKMTYTGGWTYTTTGTWPDLVVTADSIPHAVREATLMVVQNLHTLSGKGKGWLGMGSLSALQAGSAAAIPAEAQRLIPKQARELLHPYRKQRLGF